MLPAIVLLILISALLCMVLAAYAWRTRSHPASAYFALAMVLCGVWAVGFVFEIVSSTLTGKLFWSNVQFFGIEPLPVAWLAMTLHYTGAHRRWGWIVSVLWLVPVASLLIIWTNGYHHLFRGSPLLEAAGRPFPVLVNDYGLWFYVGHAFFSYAMFIASLVLLLRAWWRAAGTYRRQIVVLLVSTVLPVTVDLLYVAGVTPIADFNLTTVAFSTSGLLIAWSLFSYRFLDLMPVARSVLVDTMDDAWIVVDVTDRVLDLNKTAERVLGRPLSAMVGRPLGQIAGGGQLAACLQEPQETPAEIEVRRGEGIAWYDLRRWPLNDSRGRRRGCLIVLRDITRRKRVEAERERLLIDLQAALAKVEKLEGMLPICANCKRIRDENGVWHNVEVYIQDHSKAEFSHGICPECAKRLYPDYTF
jgi:PAS domain S-box-containing protein